MGGCVHQFEACENCVYNFYVTVCVILLQAFESTYSPVFSDRTGAVGLRHSFCSRSEAGLGATNGASADTFASEEEEDEESSWSTILPYNQPTLPQYLVTRLRHHETLSTRRPRAVSAGRRGLLTRSLFEPQVPADTSTSSLSSGFGQPPPVCCVRRKSPSARPLSLHQPRGLPPFTPSSPPLPKALPSLEHRKPAAADRGSRSVSLHQKRPASPVSSLNKPLAPLSMEGQLNGLMLPRSENHVPHSRRSPKLTVSAAPSDSPMLGQYCRLLVLGSGEGGSTELVVKR